MTLGKVLLTGTLLLILTFVIAYFQSQVHFDTYLALALIMIGTSIAAWFLYIPRG